MSDDLPDLTDIGKIGTAIAQKISKLNEAGEWLNTNSTLLEKLRTEKTDYIRISFCVAGMNHNVDFHIGERDALQAIVDEVARQLVERIKLTYDKIEKQAENLMK